MNGLVYEEKVKEIGVIGGKDDDYLCIELLSGLRLMGPLNTKPIPRESASKLVPPDLTEDFFDE